MIWAKAEKKTVFPRPRMTMMAMYTVGLCLLSLTAFAAEQQAGFRITLEEAERMISEELVNRGAGENIRATVIGRRTSELVSRDVPVVMELSELSMDAAAQRFSAVVDFSTEADINRPAQRIGNMALNGRYDEIVEVPVLKYRLSSGDIIREQDIEMQQVALSRLDRDAVRDMEDLVGKSPVRGVTPGRAVRNAEIQHPPVVLRRMPVTMRYETQNVSISAIGTAMQDGAMGDRIKVRNDDSGVILDARVIDRGHVEVTPAIVIN